MLMVEKNNCTANEMVLKSYEQKGTFKIAQNIIKHRGIMGLYSGYQLHLRKCHAYALTRTPTDTH